jgi:hypothetical protein
MSGSRSFFSVAMIFKLMRRDGKAKGIRGTAGFFKHHRARRAAGL